MGSRQVDDAGVLALGVLAGVAADAILNPDHIAANYVMLHRQPRDAWTHELDLGKLFPSLLPHFGKNRFNFPLGGSKAGTIWSPQ